MRSRLEEELASQLRLLGTPDPERDLRFHPTRRWMFDFAWPAVRLAVEVEGGVFTRGRHVRWAGLVGDGEKLQEAGRLGWKVLRFHGGQVRSGEAVTVTAAALVERRVPLWGLRLANGSTARLFARDEEAVWRHAGQVLQGRDGVTVLGSLPLEWRPALWGDWSTGISRER